MADVKTVLLVGVGGQGTILASNLLTAGLIELGYDVKMSEVHGMAQRGGSVSTQVRYGKEVFSPLIGEGQADVLVAFEAMEASRWLNYLKPGGKVIVNNYRIPSAPILIGKIDYPDNVLDEVAAKAETKIIDATKIATELGNAKALNVVLLGALIKAAGLTGVDWEAAIRKTVKPKTVDMNIKAFQAGLNA